MMPKRGERLAWRMRYEWDNGVKGVVVCDSEEQANGRADETRLAAERQDRTVTVNVYEVKR